MPIRCVRLHGPLRPARRHVGRRRADEIERAYRRLARRYHPGDQPGRSRRRGDVPADPAGVRRARATSSGAATTTAARERRGRSAARRRSSFEGFDFSAPAEGPLAATFSELFADVFQDAAREATTPSRGARHRGRRCDLSFKDAMRGGQFPLSVVRQERCPTCAGDGRVPRPPVVVSGVRRAGHAPLGARAHGVHQAVRRVRGHGPPERAGVPRVRRRRRAAAQRSRHRRGAAGHRVGRRASPCRDAATPARAAARPAICTSRSTSRAHPFFRRAGRDLHLTLPVAVHEAALGARSRGADARRARPAADSAGHARRVSSCASAGTACRPATGDGRERRRSCRRRPDRAAAGHATSDRASC